MVVFSPLAGAVTEIVSGFPSCLFSHRAYGELFQALDPSSLPNLTFYPLMYPKFVLELKPHSNIFEESPGNFKLCTKYYVSFIRLVAFTLMT